MNNGLLYIIGAGPGDPELITVKALKAIKECDVIFYDSSISLELFSEGKSTLELHPISENISDTPYLPDELNKMILTEIKQNLIVGVVQGGDPFIFGLGAEIARAAAEAKVKFKIIPGITSAIAVAAYSGIPLTYRGYSSTLVLATGHTDLNKKYADVNWQKIATGIATLVFFMGIDNLAMIVANLIKYGRDHRTPVAVVSCGTTPQQKTVTARLDSIVSLVDASQINPPAIIIVGDVVGLRKELNWFENV